MATIVLNGADFSENNLGTIDVEFSPATRRLLSMFDIVEDESDTLQKSINLFVNKLVSSGLWGEKIKALCLPFLSEIAHSGDLSYAQKNVIDGNNFFASDIAGSLILSAHGLKASYGANPVVYANFKGIVNSPDDYHVAGFDVSAEERASNDAVKFIFGGDFGHCYGLCTMKATGTNTMNPAFYVRSNNTVASNLIYEQNHLIIGNFKKTGVSTSVQQLFYKGILNNKDNGAYDDYSNNNPKMFAYSNTQYQDGGATTNAVARASFGILSMGLSLNEDECKAFEDAASALMSAVMNHN